MYGLDYAFSPTGAASFWASPAWIGALKTAGVKFVCRYLSPYSTNDANGKNLTAAEAAALKAAGIAIVVVFESTAGRMKAGYAAGTADAQHSDAVVKALGMAGIPVYFAADWDATPGDQTAINAYLDGAASVIGRARVGIYGGYYPVKRALDAGKATYAWQTLAWSGGQWDSRAAIRQNLQVKLAGAFVDPNNTYKADFGQWPRPGAIPDPKPVAEPTLRLTTPHMTGDTVSRLQQRLNLWGAHLDVDGDFGTETRKAVIAFQTKAFGAGPDVDGIVGRVTWGALLKSPAPSSDWRFRPPRKVAVLGAGPTSVKLEITSPSGGFVGNPPGQPGIDHYEIAMLVVGGNGKNIPSYPRWLKKGLPVQQWQGGSLPRNTKLQAWVRACLADTTDHASGWYKAEFTTAK